MGKPYFSKETSVNYAQSGYVNAGIAGSYGPGQLGQTSPCTPAADVSEIDIRLRDLDATLEDMRSIAAGFGVKLQNVLTPQMANKSGGTEAPRPVVSPMSDRLDKLNSEMRFQYHILRDIFDRIAL